MTLDEMIKQEQENAQKNQEAVKVEESQKVEQHFGGSEDNNTQQATQTQTQTQSSGTTISTIASSLVFILLRSNSVFLNNLFDSSE